MLKFHWKWSLEPLNVKLASGWERTNPECFSSSQCPTSLLSRIFSIFHLCEWASRGHQRRQRLERELWSRNVRRKRQLQERWTSSVAEKMWRQQQELEHKVSHPQLVLFNINGGRGASSQLVHPWWSHLDAGASVVHISFLCRFTVSHWGEAACCHQLSQESVLAAAMTRGSCGSVESALTALYYT